MDHKPQPFTCGWCRKTTTALPIGDQHTVHDDGIWPSEVVDRYATFQCRECGGWSVANWEEVQVDWVEDGPTLWVPQSPSANPFVGVPESIKATAREAWSCYENENYQAAVTVARTVIEKVGKENGYTQYGIDAKIKAMVSDNVLPRRLQNAVLALKDAGNAMVHGDLDVTINAPDAETWLTVVDQMLEEMYIAPERIRKLTEKVRGMADQEADEYAVNETSDEVDHSPSAW